MAKVKVLKDKDGNKVYPITSENAVIDSDGKSVGSKIKTIEEELSLKIGNLDELETTEKSSIVAAINETAQNISSSVEPALDDIPCVYIDGTLPQTKATGYVNVKIHYVSRSLDFDGYASAKLQGASPESDLKKSYNLKLFKDEACTSKQKINFRGWGKESKFTLKSDWGDRIHGRNICSSLIYRNMVLSRDDFENYPDEFKESPMYCQYDGFLIKVFFNGIYQGIYTWMMKKEDYTYNCDADNTANCMLQLDRYTQYNMFRERATITIDTDSEGYGAVDQLHESVPENIQTSWNNVIDFVKDSTDGEFKANINTYFYLSSLIDTYIYIVSGGMTDNFANNQFFVTYDGIRWISTMYDMDTTWGNDFNGAGTIAYTITREDMYDYQNGARTGNLLFMRLVENFGNEIKERYTSLRNGALSNSEILSVFEKKCIASKELIDEDSASTTANGAFTGMQTATTMTHLRDWVNHRFANYCDDYFNGLFPTGFVKQATLDSMAIGDYYPVMVGNTVSVNYNVNTHEGEVLHPTILFADDTTPTTYMPEISGYITTKAYNTIGLVTPCVTSGIDVPSDGKPTDEIFSVMANTYVGVIFYLIKVTSSDYVLYSPNIDKFVKEGVKSNSTTSLYASNSIQKFNIVSKYSKWSTDNDSWLTAAEKKEADYVYRFGLTGASTALRVSHYSSVSKVDTDAASGTGGWVSLVIYQYGNGGVISDDLKDRLGIE